MKNVQIVVEIQMSPEGDIKSVHRPASLDDRRELETWPSGGLVHISHSLFIEALRRESYTMALAMLSTGIKPEDLTAEGIDERVRAHFIEMVSKYSEEVSKETLDMIQGAMSKT